MANIAKIAEKNKAGQLWAEYCAKKIGTANVYEFWTIGDDEDPDGPVSTPEIRFWLEGDGGEKKYFECFPSLADHLHEQFTLAARQGADVEVNKLKQTEALKLKRITLYVAAFVFIAVVASLIVAFYKEPSYLVAFLLGSVIASACVLFFGVWQPITLPDWLQKS